MSSFRNHHMQKNTRESRTLFLTIKRKSSLRNKPFHFQKTAKPKKNFFSQKKCFVERLKHSARRRLVA